MSNRIGDGEYLRFTRDGTRECVYLRPYADTFADQRGYTRSFKPSAGNIVLRACRLTRQVVIDGVEDDEVLMERFIED
jgi:hypothetical protein